MAHCEYTYYEHCMHHNSRADDDTCHGKIKSKTWFDDDGEMHRDNGPALIHKACCHGDEWDIVIRWLQHGEHHREDGPSSIARRYKDDFKTVDRYGELWYKDGKNHREDGPAHITINADGPMLVEWYMDDVEFDIYDLEEFCALPFGEQVAIKLLK